MNNVVEITEINVSLFREMLENGYRNLKRNMTVVDELNVFPVPDGDTGKNMTMTLEGGVSGARGEFTGIGEMMQRFSRSSLLAARGNSGVILSQFIRGLAEGSKEVTAFTLPAFAAAFRSGTNYAYKAVATPVEGTMLTLLREGADYLESRSFPDFYTCFTDLLAELRRSLQHTPELLPVLKEANVVDSGGAGLVCIFEGMLMWLRGEQVEATDAPETAAFSAMASFDENSTLEFGYCTEFILQLLTAKTDLTAFRLDEMTAKLQTMGDSVVTVQDGSLIKVHVHTFEPETVLGYARRYGEFVTLKIENMSVQHNETQQAKPKRQKYAVVATATGAGLIRFFTEVGVSRVIDGGRTNNPSAEAFIEAFKQVNAEYIIVLPNDSNVIMTARQAATLYKEADVRVLNTHSLAEGYSALSMMDLSADTVEQVLEDMSIGLPNVTTGYVTTSIRDACLNGVEIRKGDWMGLVKDTVYASTTDPLQAALQLFERLPEMDEKQVVTAICGKGIPAAELQALEDAFAEQYPLVEIGFIQGDQDVYRYIFAIE